MKTIITILSSLNIILPIFASNQQNNTTIKTDIVIVVDPGLRKTYGTADPDFTYVITSGELPADVHLTGKPERVLGEGTGIYEIMQGNLALNNANYNLVFVGGCFQITKAFIMIQAEDVSKKIGENDPELRYVIQGELPEGVMLTGSIVRSAGESPGKHIIRKGTLSAGPDYDIIFIKGYLTIEDEQQGIRNLEHNKGVYVYPNPVNRKLEIANYQGDENAQIFDVCGRQIVNCQLSNHKSVDVSNLLPGVYFIRVKNSTIKFVKE